VAEKRTVRGYVTAEPDAPLVEVKIETGFTNHKDRDISKKTEL
jgi:hypothetical protein